MKIVVNAFEVKTSSSAGLPYSDVAKSAWYFDYLNAAYQNDLLEESAGKYYPSANMNR